MDSEAYLNRIAASSRKNRSNNNSISSSIWVKVLIAVTAVVLIFIVISNILDSGDSVKDKITSLKLHTTNLSNIIKTYQPRIKSSSLRSASASFNGVIINTTSGLSNYLTDKYGAKDDKEASKKITKKETDLYEELNDDLFSARINGLLDRTYASKMAYEITVISTRSKEILKLNKNSELKNILETSLNSLDNLYNSFNNYSETR